MSAKFGVLVVESIDGLNIEFSVGSVLGCLNINIGSELFNEELNIEVMGLLKASSTCVDDKLRSRSATVTWRAWLVATVPGCILCEERICATEELIFEFKF